MLGDLKTYALLINYSFLHKENSLIILYVFFAAA